MFTLKLYRKSCPSTDKNTHKVISVHHVVVHQIGEKNQALELLAYPDQGRSAETYYIGAPEPGMDAHGRDDLHFSNDDGSWWGWGLLENSEGRTTEHYRPASFG